MGNEFEDEEIFDSKINTNLFGFVYKLGPSLSNLFSHQMLCPHKNVSKLPECQHRCK